VKINNVVIYNADPKYACTISGLPGNYIEDLQLSNIRIYYKGGYTQPVTQAEIPENANKYPEPGMFGPTGVYGLFARHVKDLQISDFQVGYMEKDVRPALRFDDIQGIYLHHVVAQSEPGADVYLFNRVSGITFLHCPGIPDQEMGNLESQAVKKVEK
jgi:hypothetical protein